jgi:large subunit ribosomal protein L28
LILLPDCVKIIWLACKKSREVHRKMAKCEVCGKEVASGNRISIARSHVSRRASRTWRPNLRTVRVEVNGEKKKMHVCAKCLRSSKAVNA